MLNSIDAMVYLAQASSGVAHLFHSIPQGMSIKFLLIHHYLQKPGKRIAFIFNVNKRIYDSGNKFIVSKSRGPPTICWVRRETVVTR